MAELDIKALIARVEQAVYGDKDNVNKDGRIQGAQEGLALAKELAGLSEEEKEQTMAEIMGFTREQKVAENMAKNGVAKQRRVGAKEPVMDYSINIQLKLEMVNNITIKYDSSGFEETINELFEKYKQFTKEERPQFIEELVTALVLEFEDQGVDLTRVEELLEGLQDKVGEIDESVDIIKDNQQTMIRLMKSSLRYFTKLGLKLDTIIEQNDKSYAKLAAIYDALVELEDKVGTLDVDMQNAINNCITKFGGDISAVVTAVNALKEAGDVNTQEIVKKIEGNTQAIKDLSGVIEQFDVDMQTQIQDLAGKVIANGEELKELVRLTRLMQADIGTIKADTKECKQIQKDIYDALDKLGPDLANYFGDIVDAINNKEVTVDFSGLQPMFEEVVKAINNNTDVSVQNKREIIEAMGKIVVNPGNVDLSTLEGLMRELIELTKANGGTLKSIDAKLNLLNLSVDTANTKLEAIKDKIPDSWPDYSAQLKEIIDLLAKIDRKELPELPDNTDVLNELSAILTAINNLDLHVECNCNCGGKEEGKHEGIIDSLGLIEASARRLVGKKFDDSDSTPVQDVKTESKKEIVGYTTLGGIESSEPVRGQVNIVRYSDGTTAKKLFR